MCHISCVMCMNYYGTSAFCIFFKSLISFSYPLPICSLFYTVCLVFTVHAEHRWHRHFFEDELFDLKDLNVLKY